MKIPGIVPESDRCGEKANGIRIHSFIPLFTHLECQVM